MNSLLNPLRSLIRASAFLRAEIFEMLRQPRLILTLVLGPFLILLLFGIGYRNTARPLRTLFVVDPSSQLAPQIRQMGPNLGPQLIYAGQTADLTQALDRLKAGEIDIVAAAPPKAFETIQNNQQATFTLYHHEIDPTQVDYVKYFGQVYIDEVNRRVLTLIIKEGSDGLPTRLDPVVMVSPFVVATKDIAAVQPTIAQFFAPSVIALLLQHLAVTFAALSIIRERLLGTFELFRVSPLSPLETLLGKYLSYMIFGGIVAAILSGLIFFGLNEPMLGDWRYYAVTVAALLFASLGFGFVFSLTSTSESGAVQLAMMFLLATVFFSGFFMRLDMLWEPIRAISWLLPATYSIALLRDVLLRGPLTDPNLLLYLFAMGLVLFLMAWLLLKRRMARA